MSNVRVYDSQDGLLFHQHQECHWHQPLPLHSEETKTWFMHFIFIQTPRDELYIHIIVSYFSHVMLDLLNRHQSQMWRKPLMFTKVVKWVLENNKGDTSAVWLHFHGCQTSTTQLMGKAKSVKNVHTYPVLRLCYSTNPWMSFVTWSSVLSKQTDLLTRYPWKSIFSISSRCTLKSEKRILSWS